MADWVHALAGMSDCGGTPVLHLFGGPYVTVDKHRIDIPEGGSRLVAFIALHDSRVERRYAAGSLWPEGDDLRAAGNLRSALWRLKRACVPMIFADKRSLMLCEDIVVDVHVVTEWANRLIKGSEAQSDLEVRPWCLDSLELLPGWYEDWALIERERLRQRCLHALEALSVALVRAGRCAEAVEAAMLAVSSEPLRESAQRTLIEAHLAEGNWVEARKRFDDYRRLLLRELGAEPHSHLSELLRRTRHRDQLPEQAQSQRGPWRPGRVCEVT